jgi:hypothetical protein
MSAFQWAGERREDFLMGLFRRMENRGIGAMWGGSEGEGVVQFKKWGVGQKDSQIPLGQSCVAR